MSLDKELYELAQEITLHDREYVFSLTDITSLIETLLKRGVSKEIVLKCENVDELKAIGIYQNILRK